MFREDLRKEIDGLLNSLERFKELQIGYIADENLKKSFEEVKGAVLKGIEKISKDVKVLSEQVEWKSFNVAFFGETNAGKSTIIEALTRGHGESIGDGRKDFTREIHKNPLGNINLLDMPGIEGKEGKVISEIRKAINKSHVVFYVIGTNKEPEKGTLQKVRTFLNKRAKVYSIINIRGKPSTYKYRKQLVDKNTRKLEDRVKGKLQISFNGHYQGNINLNAFLGFIAVGKPKKKDLKKEQEKLKKIFGSFEEAYKLSNLHKLEETIKNLSQNAIEEIKVSSTYKFLNALSNMLNKILKNKKEFDKEINKINELAKKYQSEIEDIYLKYKRSIKKLFDSILNEMEITMRKRVYEGIDNKWPEDYMQEDLKLIQKEYKNKIEKEIKNNFKNMEEEIKLKIEEFERRLDLHINLGEFEGEFDVKKIKEKLKINLSYIFKQIVDTVVSIAQIIVFASQPILLIIAAVFTVLRKIWDWFFGDPKKRKKEAKRKAYYEIKRSVNDTKKQIDMNLKSEFRRLRRKIQDPIKLFEKRARDLREISRQIDEIIRVIKKTQKNISTLLAREILDKSIEVAYIDLNLSSILIIGGDEIPEDKRRLLRIKNIKSYSSLSECMRNMEYKEEETGVIYIKDEFLYRAFDAFSLDNDGYRYKIRKWRWV